MRRFLIQACLTTTLLLFAVKASNHLEVSFAKGKRRDLRPNTVHVVAPAASSGDDDKPYFTKTTFNNPNGHQSRIETAMWCGSGSSSANVAIYMDCGSGRLRSKEGRKLVTSGRTPDKPVAEPTPQQAPATASKAPVQADTKTGATTQPATARQHADRAHPKRSSSRHLRHEVLVSAQQPAAQGKDKGKAPRTTRQGRRVRFDTTTR